ncbi:MAG: sn-glycerol-3-phosphate ABC transporter ATP-binding protein UgpC [Rhodobacterales bacterium]|nr:sn-glycerol-3-phosphate ABC transporter ATP-binding protein UgpC [Rhodobacterales bacterium]
MAQLTLTNIEKSYGETKVLHGINLDVTSGEFVVFVGPSGCGKSTLLRMIAGLESITGGEMQVDGQRFNEVPPAKRGVAMVFQNYALYPHMTVYRNMSYGLKIAKNPPTEIDRKVRAAADMLQLTPFLDRRPGQLSGGQRQRVAIGRAVVRDPRLFLFDEPLSNLDAALRVATRVEIARLKEAMSQTTMIYVTHDQTEAMTMADRIVVMNGGRIEQVGSPLDLYHHPANRFVAGFIGSPAMNFLKPDSVRTSWPPSSELIGVRPEHLTLTPSGFEALVSATATLCERLGEVTITHLTLPDGQPVIAKLPGGASVERGDLLDLSADPSNLHFFDKSGQALAAP